MDINLQTFPNEQFGDLRTIEEDGKVLFCGFDVAKALGYAVPRKALFDHCKGVLKRNALTNGGEQEMSFIPEGDVYRLIAHSKLPKAQEFESWVFDEVLPTIRKNGAYMTDDTLEKALTSPDFLIQLATQLKEEKEARRALEAENAAMHPKALFADAVTASHTSILIGELAKILKQNGIDIGQNKLFERLRQDGYLMKTGSSKNMPTQSAMEKGLFEIKESTKTEPNGSIRIMRTTKVTGKGQMYFVNLFLNKASDNATA